MRVTKRQALQLFDIVSASLLYGDIGPWSQSERRYLIEDIVDQQDGTLVTEGDGDVIEAMRKLLRDEGIVQQGMGVAVRRSVDGGVEGVEAVQLRADDTEEKAAYDW